MYMNAIKKAWHTCAGLTISAIALLMVNIFFIVPAAALIKHALGS